MADADISQYIDPNAYAQAQRAKEQANALAYAQMSPADRAALSGYQFGGALGKAAGGLFGIKDRGLEEVTAANEIMKGVDRQDPKAMYEAAKVLGQQGYMKAGEAVFRQAQLLEERASKLAEQGAKTEYEKARAATAGMEKKSTADVAQMKDKIAQIEQDLADGKPISTKDLAYARAALVQLKQGKTYQDKEGRIIQVPGIDPNEFAPTVAAKVFGATAAPQGAPVAASAEETQRLQGDKRALERELSRINPKEERYGIIQRELDKVNAKLGGSPAVATQGTTRGITVTELPKSSATVQAEQEKAQATVDGLNTALANVDVALKRVSPWSTGYGALLKGIPQTDAMALNDIVRSLQSESVFSQLSALKEQSKTGASGLGSVTEKEIGLLESRIRSLNPQSKTFVEDLKAVQAEWTRIRNKTQAKAGKPKINWEATVQNKMKQGYTREQVEAALTSQGYTK